MARWRRNQTKKMTNQSPHETKPNPAIRLSKEPLTWPDSPGWWWCREILAPKAGGEICVFAERDHNDKIVVNYDYGEFSENDEHFSDFRGMEWIKADCPWGDHEH